jgi:hypothetical protein
VLSVSLWFCRFRLFSRFRVITYVSTSPTEKRRSRIRPFFQKLLRFGFPGWQAVRVLQATDRVRHQTAALLRVILARGPRRRAVLAVYPEEPADLTNRILSASLLWWHSLCRRQPCDQLQLLLPEGWSERILLMLPRFRVPFACYKYRPGDSRSLRQIYPRPVVASEIRSPYVVFRYTGEAPEILQEMKAEFPELDLVYRRDRWELGYLGFKVAWYDTVRGICLYDLLNPTVWHPERHESFRAHVRDVLRLRAFPAPEPGHAFFRLSPELWLESLILRDHRAICRDFSDVIYSQVPTCLDGERKVLDLLTVTRSGQLAVIELKIQKDLDLVFQGIDYWERVEHHLRQGDFEQAGYFEGIRLAGERPLLYLVCPLFEFHRVMPVFRHYLRAQIDLRCLGINSNWREGIKILRRFEF